MWRNLGVGIACSVLNAIIPIAVVPLLIRYLGLEAYGLVGFHAAMLAMFAWLDLGMAATVSREIARRQAVGDIASVRSLLRTFEAVYAAVAVLQMVGVVVTAPTIASVWLNAESMAPSVVAQAVILMGVVIGLRWPIGLYQGALQGAHRLATASLISSAATIASNLGALLILSQWAPTITAFFVWQAITAVLHLVTMRMAAWRSVGGSDGAQARLSEIRRVGRFAVGVGLTGAFGVLLINLDRLLLSRLVSLEALGIYSLALLVPRGLLLIVGPVFSVVFPRFSGLVADNDKAAAVALYHTGTRLLLAVIFPGAAFISLFANSIFALWTGDAALAAQIAPIATFLLIGSALNGAMHFPYSIQLAYGHSRVPAMITAGLSIAFVPLLLVLIERQGVLGAAMAWALLNVGYVFVGTAATHIVVGREYGAAWLANDVGIPAVITAAAVILVGYPALLLPFGQFEHLLLGGALAAVTAFGIALTVPNVRKIVSERRIPAELWKGTLG